VGGIALRANSPAQSLLTVSCGTMVVRDHRPVSLFRESQKISTESHPHQKITRRDYLFLKFVKWIFLVMILYGAGMSIVILLHEDAIGLRMVNAFSTMFSGLLGLGAGYILAGGARVEEKEDNGKESVSQGSSGDSER
jgi:hypothetical protein